MARIEQSRWAKSNAELRLSYTSIRSPFHGIIDRIPFKVGSLIDHGTLMTTVSDISEVFVYFNASEGEYLEYVKNTIAKTGHKNKLVTLMLADGSKYPFEGNVETMGGEFQASTGSISFRARFPLSNVALSTSVTSGAGSCEPAATEAEAAAEAGAEAGCTVERHCCSTAASLDTWSGSLYVDRSANGICANSD